MKKNSFVVSLLISILLGFAVNSSAMERVAWIKIGLVSDFYAVVERIMVAAAKDLEMELRIYNANGDPFYFVPLAQKILADPKTRPDCLLINNFRNRADKILELGEEFGVPVFIFNTGFPADSKVGKPREKYPHWIGQILPDDEYGGYLLAKELIKKAKELKKNQTTPIQMVALEGIRTNEASNKRVAGLKRALADNPDIVINQFFHSKYRVELAKEAFHSTLRRYPHTSIFWTASESMAIAVIEEAKKQGLFPGKDIFTGGFDLLPENKKYLESGDMTASVGGHYFEGAWALVLVRDYLKGIDFGRTESTSFTSMMTSQTQENISKFKDIYSVLSDTALNELDFKSLSKYYNPKVKKYNFELSTFLQSNIK